MKRIQDIISSEVTTKVNNVNLRKERGTVGSSSNIVIGGGGETLFNTDYTIEEIIYVTDEWNNLISSDDYQAVAKNQIDVFPAGAPVINGNKIHVAYLRERGAFTTGKTKGPTVPPYIDTFYLTPQSGGTGTTTFDFSIVPQDGVNISWSILRAGGAIPLYQGTALASVAGQVSDGSGGYIDLTYIINTTDQENYEDTGLPFTLVVSYEILGDISDIVGTVFAETVYSIDPVFPLTALLEVTPDIITVLGSNPITSEVTINNPSGIQYDWQLRRDALYSVSLAPGDFEIIASGLGETGAVSQTFPEDFNIVIEQQNISFNLLIREQGEQFYSAVDSDLITVAIAGGLELAHVGYAGISDVLYEVTPGVWIPVNTEVEYTSRIPVSSFTKDVDSLYLSNNTYLQATVEAGITESVYFIIEVPDSWGDIEFYQDLGTVNPTYFNKIQLTNNYTAYIYVAGSSSYLNPVDFKIRPETP